ncbi:MAG: type I DNA topoisomerase [Bacilli bacterium]|nr:type I DNA topoisomerase [Bacilli bacterium]MDY6430402.1 type I DNA topoisomerase [Bacilli bacterium]
MKLVIVESPNKCKTIQKYLGSDYEVVASNGNFRDLSTKGKGGLGIDINANFKPDWVIDAKKKGLVRELQSKVSKAEEVYLASDPDREGEAISFHLASVLNLPIESAKRLRFHEITKPVIDEVIRSPSTIDLNLVNAQLTRRIEDRIIGFKLSTLLSKSINIKSAGRVQSATLKLIVDKQKAIDEFVPEEYWTISVEIELKGNKYELPLSKLNGKQVKISSLEEAEKILERLPETLEIKDIKKEVKSVSPKPALTTSTMQQEAYKLYKFSSSKTQTIAQKLFEGVEINGERIGVITYLRTDSTRISSAFYTRHAVPFFLENFPKEYIAPYVDKTPKSSLVQDAHEAIRPTGTHRTPESMEAFLSSDELKLYKLIYYRALASLMSPKKEEATTVTLEGNGLEFALKGSRVLFDGFTALFKKLEKEEGKALPEISKEDVAKVIKTKKEQKFTKPEPAYNEASIIKAMEDNGIGRPSTYASTMVTLFKRKYIAKNKGSIYPTEDGKKSIEVLDEYFPRFVSSTYTADMERILDTIEEGKLDYIEILGKFYSNFMETYDDVKGKFSSAGGVPTGEICPSCGSPLVYKSNKHGSGFIGCSNYPACTYVQKEEKEVPEETGEICPSCGSKLVYRVSKKGEKFIACSNFPKCKYTASIGSPSSQAKEPAKITEKDYVKPCPSCGDGHLIIKQGKKVKFLGCTNYPKCKYHEWLNKKEDAGK